jgi:phosphatidylserine/phosphatidylglycerophosphate/cardiolipin synthase-like enzyme
MYLFLLILLSSPISVYFSKSVDPSVSSGVVALGNVKLDSIYQVMISQATYSLDLAIYNLRSWAIVDSIVSVWNRGVKVRVITEADHRDNEEIQALEAEGIPVLDDTAGNNSGYGYMHDKFVIIDARDSTDTTNDFVMTGSYNPSSYTDNADNLIVIHSHSLAQAYTMEFEEMWGSSSDYPNPNNAKFGTRKTDNTPHSFVVEGIPIELYFSPSDDALSYLIQEVQTADIEIDFCIFSFTRQDLSDAMKERYDQGVLVQGVFDAHDWLGPYSESNDMTGGGENPWDPPAPVYPDSVSGYLHHKYMVIDPWEIFGGNPVIVTGSMNWSTRGNFYNDENTLIIHSPEVANLYLQEFVARYTEAGGDYTGYLCGDVNRDWSVNTIDLAYLANYFFNGGPPPPVLQSCDVNRDGSVNALDLTYIATFLFLGGNPPCSS